MIPDRFTRMLVGAHEGCRRNPTVEGIHMHYALVLLACSRAHDLGGRLSHRQLFHRHCIIYPKGKRA